MKNKILSAGLFLIFIVSMVFAQSNNPSPYPGGSPFPAGGEPALTHTVKVFWATEGKIDTTVISIKAEGQRPTQSECAQVVNGKSMPCEGLYNGIAPDCDYSFSFTNTSVTHKDIPQDTIKVNGQGTLLVRVYGFSAEDYNKPPVVKAQYYYQQKLVGETTVQAEPIADKLHKS
ncbi:MAG: hypothetical protein Q8O30_01555 [Candidatus Omnitrophota bacterium]|nr:hypothetical protein [Candidatus Omnitrophota bacterium]